ncbi:hypothetical protein LAZ67_20000379 [Cordylochernes scorpioides]|uniref:Protein kinase domain-containing protein n=1 Tax=Cordylochernes scorpioides TaxID=51811 RepID=A0ABY6LMZ2_9ARAC|nr:hypothetical protein LAZ67_20000379 [Cordylochernes scorpioides]
MTSTHQRIQYLNQLSPSAYKDEYKNLEECSFIKILGYGTDGIIHKVSFNGKQVAVKEFKPRSQIFPPESKNEIQFLKELEHKNVISYYGLVTVSLPNDMYVMYGFLEFCECSLERVIKNPKKQISYQEKKNIVSQIVEGLDYLVKKSIVHCDLKPGNILMTHNGEIKIADFGLTRKLTKEENFTSTYYNVVSLWYRAPEILNQQPYSFGIDMWSLGLIIAELWLRKPLLKGKHEKEQKMIIQNLWTPGSNQFIDNVLTNIDSPAFKLVKQLLQIDPSKRSTIEDVKKSEFLEMIPNIKRNRSRLPQSKIPNSLSDHKICLNIQIKNKSEDKIEDSRPKQRHGESSINKNIKEKRVYQNKEAENNKKPAQNTTSTFPPKAIESKKKHEVASTNRRRHGSNNSNYDRNEEYHYRDYAYRRSRHNQQYHHPYQRRQYSRYHDFHEPYYPRYYHDRYMEDYHWQPYW